nr:MAG TPA: spore cortex-lytic enzyme [Caudoviricetes sp.]
MGAHTAHAPLADQVSIRDRPVSATAFTRILKYGGAAPTPPPTPGGGTGNFSQSTFSGNTGKGVLKVTSKEIIKAFQSILKANGYYKGQIDGLIGPLTREALRKAGVK